MVDPPQHRKVRFPFRTTRRRDWCSPTQPGSLWMTGCTAMANPGSCLTRVRRMARFSAPVCTWMAPAIPSMWSWIRRIKPRPFRSPTCRRRSTFTLPWWSIRSQWMSRLMAFCGSTIRCVSCLARIVLRFAWDRAAAGRVRLVPLPTIARRCPLRKSPVSWRRLRRMVRMPRNRCRLTWISRGTPDGIKAYAKPAKPIHP